MKNAKVLSQVVESIQLAHVNGRLTEDSSRGRHNCMTQEQRGRSQPQNWLFYRNGINMNTVGLEQQ